TLPELIRRLQTVMDGLAESSEVVLVDDGSTDGSYDLMLDLHRRDPRVKALRLTRNFGHQMAITAGLDHALGRAVIIMDGDLQDPPEVALELIQRWREGYDVVYAVRATRSGESWLKRKTAKAFYRLMGRLGDIDIPQETGDFRLVDRQAVDAVTAMREHRRYLRGMFAWVGYRQTGLAYERDARYAGKTKFSLGRMVAFAIDGIVSFSEAPLRVALAGGFVVSALSFLLGVVAVVLKFAGLYTVPGWASIAVGVAFFSGVQLSVTGVMGIYVARIHEEVKRRPLYLVRDSVGLAYTQARGDGITHRQLDLFRDAGATTASPR
ncbi:MAG: polyisoprenyl-phosphate glycosyltransferase, partial [Actinomycetota bacterium]|nr:polyisoprenyl-phosphate glycosyltransferase [Actinomycetota bacterium]